MIYNANYYVVSHGPWPDTPWFPITLGILGLLGAVIFAVIEVSK